ncbi:MAG: hypothetical protein KC445_09230 [Anaerolineales bacterium]|nr:hypothetical protein [Anaerolineales bacterium]
MSQMRSPHGGGAFQRGLNAPQSRFYSHGKFGRLFPALPPHLPEREALVELGEVGGPMDPGEAHNTPNNAMPAGFVFLGQFIDHDITLDTTSSLEQQNDPEAIQNFRTPLLELDNVYGSGPDATPYLYRSINRLPYMLLDEAAPHDLPRNSAGTALIGDPRNDENLVVSQLQLAFLKFHNQVLHDVRDFAKAQQLVRWHYQWIVLHEFLPLLVGQELVDSIYTGNTYSSGRRFYNWRHQPFIPVEFAVAAYRYGHAQVPGALQVNDVFKVNGRSQIPLFDVNEFGKDDPNDLSGFGARADRRFVDWRYLFDTGDGIEQPSRSINTVLSGPLFELPFFTEPTDIRSLAQRNLVRGRAFGLPSGQAVARAMGETPLSPADLDDVRYLGFAEETPLWFYILREAQVCEYGERLGPVGGRIVAEVLVGLLEGDRLSFVRSHPNWQPVLGSHGDFTMVDLLQYAGVLDTPVYLNGGAPY